MSSSVQIVLGPLDPSCPEILFCCQRLFLLVSVLHCSINYVNHCTPKGCQLCSPVTVYFLLLPSASHHNILGSFSQVVNLPFEHSSKPKPGRNHWLCSPIKKSTPYVSGLHGKVIVAHVSRLGSSHLAAQNFLLSAAGNGARAEEASHMCALPGITWHPGVS